MHRKSSAGISRTECCSCSLFVLFDFFLLAGRLKGNSRVSERARGVGLDICFVQPVLEQSSAARKNFQRCHFKAFELYHFQDQTTWLRCADQMPEFGRHSLESGKGDYKILLCFSWVPWQPSSIRSSSLEPAHSSVHLHLERVYRK